MTEELTAVDLTVSGTLPDHLDGRYLRIGPNPIHEQGPHFHWFLGEGMVHGVHLRDGRAQWYRNRWVRSADVATTLGEPVRGTPGPADFAANTNVLEHAGRTLALVEAGAPPYELTHELDTVGPCDFGGTLPSLPGRPGYSAHPHQDPDDRRAARDLLQLDARQPRRLLGARHDRADPAQRRHHRPRQPDDARLRPHRAARRGPRPARDLRPRRGHRGRPAPGATRSSVACWAASSDATRCPSRSSPGSRAGPAARRRCPTAGTPTTPPASGSCPATPTGDAIRWFEIDPCYIFHTLNAYEDGDTVVVDVVKHPRMFATVLDGPDEGPATLSRYTLDLATGRAREQGFDQRSQEFPRHDERRTGSRHRYGWAVGFDGGRAGDTVLRHDLDTGHTDVRRLGAGLEASEFCFVPTPGSTTEGDGVLLGYVFDPAAGRSHLRVLDAASLEDVAAVHLPGRVPAGFHGNWAPTGG